MRYPDSILRNVMNPAQYIGNEYNIIEKNCEDKIRICLSFPDLYSIGMSSFGHRLIYQMFNTYFDVYAERVYAVEPDMEKMLREKQISLLSLESATPIKEFDMLGFTLEYELTYTNMLAILDLSGISIRSEERKEDDPIICAGGTAIYNPFPINDFIDVFFIGEAEAMSDDIVNILRKKKSGELSRGEAIQRFDELPYTYVPRNSGAEKDVYQVINDSIDSYKYFKNPLVPNVNIVHDRDIVEISRGCTQGCRFCQAGMIYRPVREVPMEHIIENALNRIDKTGYKEITLLSLSAGDYIEIETLLRTLSNKLAVKHASISLPSLRIGSVDESVYECVSKIRKSGITIAIETASSKMKAIINKNISEEEIIETIKSGIKYGWKRFKLYFMIGLPFETDEDIDAINELINKITGKFRNIRFNVSVSPFVPRPFTPFQWCEQISPDELEGRIEKIKAGVIGRNVEMSFREKEITFLEGVFARGDERLNQMILNAYNKGARLDEWSEHFDFSIWKEAAEKAEIDLFDFLKGKRPDEDLPWDFIHTKVSRGFLEREYLAAEKLKYTIDCREDECTRCSACDGEIAGMKKRKAKIEKTESTFKKRQKKVVSNSIARRIKLFFAYTVTRDYQYLSHLRIINLMNYGMRRSGIDFVYTQGFNPKIKSVYGPPKPVGVYSNMEIMETFVSSKPDDNTLDLLNKVMPKGIQFYYMKELLSDRMSIIKQLNRLNMVFKLSITNTIENSIEKFLLAKELIIRREKEGKITEINIRDYIDDIEIGDDLIRIILKYNTVGNIKFDEIIKNVIGLEGTEDIEIYRENFYKKEENMIIKVEDL